MGRLKNNAYKTLNGIEWRVGSRSYSTDTAIFNLDSASNCISQRLGLCVVCNSYGKNGCYAIRPELHRPKVRVYRERQAIQWKNQSIDNFVSGLQYLKEKNDIKYFRFDESADFTCQADVNKMSEIAKRAKEFGVTTFGYTARKDLDFSNAQFTVWYSGHIVEKSSFGSTFVVKTVDQAHKMARKMGLKPNQYHICGSNGTDKKCGKCKVCTKAKNRFFVVFFIKH